MGQSGNSPQGIVGGSSAAPAYRDNLGFNSRWGHDRRVDGRKEPPETTPLSRASAVRASLVGFGLTALLAVAASCGGGKLEDLAARCRRVCAPNAVESLSDDFAFGTRCSCQAPVYCDDGDDGGAK